MASPPNSRKKQQKSRAVKSGNGKMKRHTAPTSVLCKIMAGGLFWPIYSGVWSAFGTDGNICVWTRIVARTLTIIMWFWSLSMLLVSCEWPTKWFYIIGITAWSRLGGWFWSRWCNLNSGDVFPVYCPNLSHGQSCLALPMHREFAHAILRWMVGGLGPPLSCVITPVCFRHLCCYCLQLRRFHDKSHRHWHIQLLEHVVGWPHH